MRPRLLRLYENQVFQKPETKLFDFRLTSEASLFSSSPPRAQSPRSLSTESPTEGQVDAKCIALMRVRPVRQRTVHTEKQAKQANDVF